jgi:hypothetical protein
MNSGDRHYRQYFSITVVNKGYLGKHFSAAEPPRMGELVRLIQIDSKYDKLYRVIQVTHTLQTHQTADPELLTSEIDILLEEATEYTEPFTGKYTDIP